MPNVNATKKTNKKSHTFEAAKDSGDEGDDMMNVDKSKNNLTRRKLSQEVVPVISTCRGIAGSEFYHFPPAHNRPNGTGSFKRTRIIRDPWWSACCIFKFRRFTTMSEVEVNQWDELSQFSFCKIKVTGPIATNGELLEGFMFAIGWRKCSTKNEQFGPYGSLRKIENAKDELRNQGSNLSLVY
ncbi:hypothetical protein O181_043074 [Austropuccinia psidii MF-1]|uniref:Tet-like 2OG-Fe(II) oxygenase domain-containing protein n=1 Tax=Austropuccinia psidii MF-1 TaxID=1389203 RepID=A0A9Q3DHB0_9BASI|nr:hypothetical protein [Austropuccinia psidii MF-1]